MIGMCMLNDHQANTTRRFCASSPTIIHVAKSLTVIQISILLDARYRYDFILIFQILQSTSITIVSHLRYSHVISDHDLPEYAYANSLSI